LCLIGFCGVASAASPWDGSWFYDAQHSIQPDVLQLSLAPDGTWTLFDGFWEVPFVADGKLHRRGSSADESRASQPDPKTLVIVTGVHGRASDTTTLSLSADGKTLMSKRQHAAWNGKESQDSTTYSRTTEGHSFQGTWKAVPEAKSPDTDGAQPEIKRVNQPPSWVIWTDTDGTMTWFIPNTGETLRGKADSKLQPIQGPLYDGEFFAWKQTSPTRLEFTAFIDGNPVEYAVETISPDGQTFTDTLWAPGHEDTKAISVFQRQP